MPAGILKWCYWLGKGVRRVMQRRELSFGYHFSDVGRSRGSRGRALLQSKRATVAAKWHITHFLLLNIFWDWILQHKGQRSNRAVGGLRARRQRGFCSPSNPESWAKRRSVSRQNLARMTISTPQKTPHFTWGPWKCGLKYKARPG